MSDFKKTNKEIKVKDLALAACLAMTAGGVQAIDIETNNPDLRILFHNTLRYNVGVRAENIDPVIASDIRNDESDLSVRKGKIVMNRLDLLSELEVDYKKSVGFRLSAAAWNDFSFGRSVTTAPEYQDVGSYYNNKYSDFTRRYYAGPSGEFLDAYVYLNQKIGEMPAMLRIGQQSVLWGEAIVLSNHSVSYLQTPMDSRKSISSPGATAKEQALPINQIYATLQLNPEVSLEAQYYLDWRYNRNPEGGTYFGVADPLMMGPDRNCISVAGPCLINERIYKPRKRGDFGLSMRWQPEWMAGGTLGFYYREFTERNAWISANPARGTYGFAFANDGKLYGISLSKSFAGVSWGAEFLKRENTALNASNTTANLDGPRGNTYHALVNATAQFGSNKLWDSSMVLAELAYSRLDKVIANEDLFTACSKRPVGQQGTEYGCSSRQNFIMSVATSANWVGVAPGLDLTAGVKAIYGLKGNAPVLSESSGKEKVGTYSISIGAEYNSAHTFTLSYNDYFAQNKKNPNGLGYISSNGGQLQDRGWISFTYQTSF